MEEKKLNAKVKNAAKWSTITEIGAKLVSPVTNMILARILAPEAFGIIATVTMIISFADMFTDSGFQKYLVQHEFKDENEKYKNANVAFWTNFGISILLWSIIVLFRKDIAIIVGNPGLGNVIAVASFQLPLTSFSSIQMALFRRDFNFKALFIVRMVSVLLPFVVSVPLALWGLNYWALIIGNLIIQISNAIILTINSKWKPRLYFSLRVLKEMLSFSIWSLIEAISIWLSIWVDSFIIGNALSPYYLGLYKTSTSMVNTLTALITSSVVPVLFSTLSRLQGDKEKFYHTFLKFQRLVAVLIFPLGVGVYLYSDLATQILLGSKWSQASGVIGIWALTRSIKIVFGNLSSEVYRAKGRPKLSFFAQVLHLVVLIPVCIISAQYGFWTLVYVRSWIQMQLVLVHFVLIKNVIDIQLIRIIKNVLPIGISTLGMYMVGILLRINDGTAWSFISIILCAISYFAMLSLFPSMRKEVYVVAKGFIPKKFRYKYHFSYTKGH